MKLLKRFATCAAALALSLTAAFATAQELAAPTWSNHSVKNTEIKLKWNKVDDALNYTLFYKEASARNFFHRVVTGTSTTYYGVKNRTYEFYLIANPKCGKGLEKSAASETKTILLNEEANPKEPLPTPTWTKHSVKNTEIKLEWSKVADALNYTLFYKEASAKKFCKRVVATNSTTYYGIKNRRYDFFVVANPKYNDGYEVSAASETKTILLNEEANPKEPLPTPTWTKASASKTKISLAWSKVADALNYTLFYKEVSAKNFCKRVVAGTSTTYYGIKGKTYEFFVVANPKYNDGYSVSAASETRTIFIDGAEAPKQKLATPAWTNVSASKTKVSLSWTKVDDALNYSLFYKEASGKNFVKRIVAKTSTTYCGIKGKTYEFYVVANPKCGSDFSASDASETATITLDDNNVVNPPVDPTKTPLAAPKLTAEVDGTTVKLSWSKVDNARYYKLFRKVKGASKCEESNAIEDTRDSFTGVPGVTYEIYAVAYPANTSEYADYTRSANSNTVAVTIPKPEDPVDPSDELTPLPKATVYRAGGWNVGKTIRNMSITVNFQLPDGISSSINVSNDPINTSIWNVGVYFAYQVKLPDGTTFKGVRGCHPVGGDLGLYTLTIEDLPQVGEQPYKVCFAPLATDNGPDGDGDGIKDQGYTHGAWSEWYSVEVGFKLGGTSYYVDPSSFPDFSWMNY